MEPISKFEVSIYGELTPFEKNPLLSQARLRIFYKYANRNRTYIDDDFAEKLLNTLPYTPVSGIWDEDEEDFTDHGSSREQGRIYGLVPQDPHRTWEDHLDPDGVIRTYACCDVVLFTARYPDAKDIVGKKHSMELYTPSIKGKWIDYEGKKYYQYTEASFIGLQVLGNKVEPCFEGSAFYTYSKSLMEMIEELDKYSYNGGKNQMDTFKLSDRAKFEKLWDMLNPYFNEENQWRADYEIIDVYEDYALTYNYADKKYERIYFAKDEENEMVNINRKEDTYIVDVSADEMTALKEIQKLNGGNFNALDTNYQSMIDEKNTLNQKVDELQSEVDTMTASLSTGAEALQTASAKITELGEQIQQKDTNYTALKEQFDGLKEFKDNADRQEKLAEIAKYTMLESSVIENFTAEVDNYSLDELSNKLKIAYVDSQAQNIFTNNIGKDQSVNHIIPTESSHAEELTGAARLVNNHKRNGGKD